MSRFVTTHTGSLPRPDYLLDLMFARESGEHVAARHAGRVDLQRGGSGERGDEDGLCQHV